MKILVLSLLRVGDLIQQKPLLNRLREKNPGAEIHLLVNKSVLPVRDLFPEVDLWFSFDRDSLQRQIGTAETPLFRPVHELAGLISELSNEHYDEIYNFTHNRLSAHLAAAIPATVKKGLLAEGLGFRAFENAWLRHFNERFGQKDGTPFHYVELLSKAFGLGETSPQYLKPRGDLLLIQPLTSDKKKNYHLTSWVQCLNQLRMNFPELQVKILGAPFERDTLLNFFELEDLAICEWADLKPLFDKAALLVTGDTSIKHLAVQSGVPILEIALGSADPEKTGAYARNAWILTSQVACAPCPHSGPCRQLSHQCGDSMRPQVVVDAILSILRGEEPESQSSPLKILKTRFTKNVGWSLSSRNALSLLEKSIWSLALDESHCPPIGSAARSLRNLMSQEGQIQETARYMLKSQRELEGLYSSQIRILQELALLCFAENLSAHRVAEVRRQLADVVPLDPVLRSYFSEIREVLAQPFASPLHFFGALKKRFAGIGHRIEFRKKVIHQIVEESNGSILGKETERSPETT